MLLANNALIDIEFYNFMVETADRVDSTNSQIIAAINAASAIFENYCGRVLKERIFSYDPLSNNFDQAYSIFDGPPKAVFYFPTYPVKEITEFIIGDEVISPATAYDDTTGYFLYKDSGKLIYSYGFDYGYSQNVKVKWTGGYSSTSAEMKELQYLCFEFMKTILNSPNNPTFQSERMGNYSYTSISPVFMNKYRGMSPLVFQGLGKYRRGVFA